LDIHIGWFLNFEIPIKGCKTVFPTPIAESWALYKKYKETNTEEFLEQAIEKIGACVGDDWRIACREWLERKQT